MKHIIALDTFITEHFHKQEYPDVSGELLKPKRGKWTKIDPKQHPELAGEFFDLIKTAYSSLGGHAKINQPSDVFADPDWNFWQGVDLHGSPDLDVIIWGQNTKYGLKFSGVGHDGEKTSTKAYLDHKGRDLLKPGKYGEVSGKLADIMLGKYKVPSVDNEEEVKKLLGGKDIEWHGEHPVDKNKPGKGWYTRNLGGNKHTKIILGKPKI